MTETRPAPWGETKVVGRPRPCVDAYERVSGSAAYAIDVTFPTCSTRRSCAAAIPTHR